MIARKMLQFQPIAFHRWICGWGSLESCVG